MESFYPGLASQFMVGWPRKQKTESVAFRKKFYDWPDPVDLKVKTVEAKVHAQVLFIIIR